MAPAACRDKDLGLLEVGKKADVTLLDIMSPEWQPVHNPIANLVYCAHGGCADTVPPVGYIRARRARAQPQRARSRGSARTKTSLIRRTA